MPVSIDKIIHKPKACLKGSSEEIGKHDLLPGDRSYCTVLSLSVSLGITYDEAYTILSKRRRRRRGLKLSALQECLNEITCFAGTGPSDMEKVSRFRKIYERPFQAKTRGSRLMLKTFAKMNNKGTYYVVVRGHALVVKDGAIIDYFNRPRRVVEIAWKIS